MTKPRKYAEQSSTGIDCPICMESYESIKIIPCKHEICSQCLDHLITSGNLLCPHCRIAFHRDSDFKTKQSWNLECSNCLELKPTKEFNWCVECARLICCLCVMRQHKSPNHTIQEWDSGIPVMASLKENFLETEDHPRQQNLLKKRMSKLFEPVFDSISKKMIDSRHQGATNLLQAFPFDTENMKKVTPNVNTEEVFHIAAKVSGIDVEELLSVPISYKDPSSIDDRVRSLMNFGLEPNFFKTETKSENQESVECSSKTLNRCASFKIKDDSGILVFRISLQHRKIVLSYEDSEHLVYNLDIFNEGTSLPEILDRSHGTEPSSDVMEKGIPVAGIFDPIRNGYFVLDRITDKEPCYFQLSVIDFDLMKRTCVLNFCFSRLGEGRLICSSSGVLFIIIRAGEPGKFKTNIYATWRNDRGEIVDAVHQLELDDILYNPVCYGIGSDTFLMAYKFVNYHIETCLYRYDGYQMTYVRRIEDSIELYFYSKILGKTSEYGNYFFKTSHKPEKLRAFTRDVHDFKISWEIQKPNIEIIDFAVEGDRLLLAFYEIRNGFTKAEEELVHFQWFSLDELKENQKKKEDEKREGIKDGSRKRKKKTSV